MFLRPLRGDPSGDLSAGVSGKAGVAWATFVDDQPVFGTEQGARITISRRRSIPFVKPLVEAVPQGRAVVPARPLRRGDVVRVDVEGGSPMAWRYDPDGNLGVPMLAFLSAIRLGTLACGLIVLGWIGAEGMNRAWALYLGGSGRGSAIITEISRNYTSLYPKKRMTSDFFDAWQAAKAKGEDQKAFFARWKEEHPLPRPDIEKTP